MSSSRRKRIDLALQGGGAHGAFTWGVLDRLLEDERIELDAVSGASAGAVNATVLADALESGGRALARDRLRSFWTRVSHAAAAGGAMAALLADWAPPALAPGSPLGWYVDWWSRLYTSWQPELLPANPLRSILADCVDFDRLRSSPGLRLIVSATNVRTGRLREFRRHELSLDAVLASACLPMLFRAVEIDGEAYWDGGYVGNPSLLPLVTESRAHDVVLVQVNPSRRDGLPTSYRAVLERVNEITFNSSLVTELRSIAMVKRLLAAEAAEAARAAGAAEAARAVEAAKAASGGRRDWLFGQIDALRLHRIDGDGVLDGLGAGASLHPAWPLVARLHRLGRQAADSWLQRNFAHLGRRSTLALDPYL